MDSLSQQSPSHMPRLPSSACDTCKRRKLKCSGSQPCERCVASSVNCTYGSGASRSNTQSYIRHLEARVGELEDALRQRVPRGDAVGSDVSADIHNQAVEDEITYNAEDDFVETIASAEDGYIRPRSNGDNVTFHGYLSGLGVLRSIRELCDQVAGGERSEYGRSIADAFDSNLLRVPASNPIASLALLPSRVVAQTTIRVALDEALSCQECIDRVRLRHQVERLYTTDPEEYLDQDRRALSLVYALLALGRQRHTADTTSLDAPREKDTQGTSYFRASQATLDATDCNHLDSIRTTICLANFLLSASMASKAYNFICIGIGAALRMGLHVYSTAMRQQFSAEELAHRRTVFAVLYYTQAYLASVLGMPLVLKDADRQQTIALPEEDVHDDGKGLTTRQPLSPLSSTIRAGRLFRISAEITEDRLTWSRVDVGAKAASALSLDKIPKWEQRLSEWREDLPPLSFDSVDRNVLRAQLILRFVETTVTIAIYRPFMQHVVRTRDDSDFSEKGFEYSLACIQASIRVVDVAQLMDEHSLLDTAQWYVIYNLAIAASSLRLVVLGKQDGTFVEAARASGETAKGLLKKLGQSNISARKCSESLDALQAAVEITTLSPRSQFMHGVGAMQL